MKRVILILVFTLISIPIHADQFSTDLKIIGDKLRAQAYKDMSYLKSQEREKLFKLVEDNDFEGAYAVGRKYLEIHPYDISAHYAMIGVAGRLKKDNSYTEHFLKYFSLLYSIVSSGDGNSFESAYIVLNESEVMITLNEFRCEPGPQDMHGEYIHITCSSKGGSGLRAMFFKIKDNKTSNKSLQPTAKGGG